VNIFESRGAERQKQQRFARSTTGRKRVTPTAATRYSVYSGQDRLGAYQRDGDSFVAFNRLGKSLGTFDTQQAAIAAIDAEVSRP
jgi:hypothetical protein